MSSGAHYPHSDSKIGSQSQGAGSRADKRAGYPRGFLPATAATATAAARATTTATAAAAAAAEPAATTAAAAAEAATATAAAAAAAEPTTAAAAAATIFRLVGADVAAVDGLAIDPGDGVSRLLGGTHRDEREAARAAGVAVDDAAHLDDFTELRERVAQCVFTGIERQVSYEYFLTHALLSSNRPAWRPLATETQSR
jgi:hypothetical protein